MILTKDGKILTKDGQILTTDGSVPRKTQIYYDDISSAVESETDWRNDLSPTLDFSSVNLDNKYLVVDLDYLQGLGELPSNLNFEGCIGFNFGTNVPKNALIIFNIGEGATETQSPNPEIGTYGLRYSVEIMTNKLKNRPYVASIDGATYDYNNDYLWLLWDWGQGYAYNIILEFDELGYLSCNAVPYMDEN